MPAELIQLGVAGVVAVVLGYILKLIIDGRLHTDGEIKIRDERIAELVRQNETLTTALAASNEQGKAIISLWKDLQSEGEEAHNGQT